MLAFYENRKNDFSVRDCRVIPKRLNCSAHLHYHIELVFMLEGTTPAFADTEQCLIEAGDAFIAFPNQIHRYESAAPERHVLLIINPNLMPDLVSIFTNAVPRKNVIKGIANDPEIIHLYEMLISEVADERYAKTMQQGYLLALFSRLLSKIELTETSSSESHSLKSVISYCMQNYQNELSLSILERELHISKYYISHLFSDKLLIGFNEYINSLRISYACHYLRHSSRPVTEIASLVGFNTARTFNRAFVKQTGTTPSEYRRAAKTIKEEKT
ncbi:MAG: AraC family transcriptional regulator [Clostridia bacterium]|nr:AraC family transcriptional regulator [Clostridia bacterium]